MWKNSLKNVESDNNKIVYETLLDFLQQNGTYFLNIPRNIPVNSSQNDERLKIWVDYQNTQTLYVTI
jgi:hypothetical protein